MKKIFILAAIGVSLIAALFLKSTCTDTKCFWKVEFQSTSQGSFSFGSDRQNPLKTSADFSGELLVSKSDHQVSFQWKHPRYVLTLGISNNQIISDENSPLYQFLNEPWLIEKEVLKVSNLIQKLNIDQRLIALNLLRKISQPFLEARWGAFRGFASDLAEQSQISTADYSFFKVKIEEQSGGTYQKPWSTTSTVYQRSLVLLEPSIVVNAQVTESLKMDQGFENEKLAKLESGFQQEILFKDIQKNAHLIKRLLRLKILSYQDFGKKLQTIQASDLNYRSAIVSLVEIGSDESIDVLLHEMIRYQKDKKISEMLLLTTLSLKRVSLAFFNYLVELSKKQTENKNLQLIVCHFSGLYAERFPKDPNRFAHLQSYLNESPENLACLGNAGVLEAENFILSALRDPNIETQKQAIFSLRFIRTESALSEILKAYRDERLVDSAKESIQARVERGIFEKELWLFLKKELKANPKDTSFLTKTGKSFIMNFPGAFRDSKQTELVTYFWN